MIPVTALPDEIREIYEKLNRSYFFECVIENKATEWNQYYDKYLEYGMNLNNFDGSEGLSTLFYDPHRVCNPTTHYLPRLSLGPIYMENKLIQGFHLEGVELTHSTFIDVKFRECDLAGALFDYSKINKSIFNSTGLNHSSFIYCTLSNVDFLYSSVENVLFNVATMKKVEFEHIPMSKTDFRSSDIEDSRIFLSNLSSCDFSYAKIDSKTSILNNNINKRTNFTGVGLSGIVMEEDVKSILEKNIRKIHWNKWYKKEKIYYWWKKRNSDLENPDFVLDAWKETNCFKWRTIKKIERVILDFPARLFWECSDYGSSTLRIILSFLILNCVFSVYYGILSIGETKLTIFSGNLLDIFLQTILVPFGITSIEIYTIYPFSLFLMVLHVILSYVILAALVTRLSVLFQNRSP